MCTPKVQYESKPTQAVRIVGIVCPVSTVVVDKLAFANILDYMRVASDPINTVFAFG